MRSPLLLTVGLLAGCALPIPPAEFATSDAFNSYAGKQLPFGDISTFDGVRKAFRAYYWLYSEEAMAKRVKEQTSSEVGFYSSIVAVLGGVFGSTTTAIVGGAGAAGAGLFSDRYRLKVQAHNYEGAATAMLCMYNLLPGLDTPTLQTLTFANGTNAETDARNAALDSLLAVRAKVAALQSSFELGQPDVSKLKDALTAPRQPLNPPSQSRRSLVVPVGGGAPPDPIETYRKDLKVCEAAFTG